MILTLVGVSRGMLADIATRTRGTDADITIRPPGSSILAFSGNMPEGIVDKVREEPHVALATGTLIQSTGNFNSITGIHLDEFNSISGGLVYLEGQPFSGPDELVIDDVYASEKRLHVGDTIDLGLKWRISGIVESGKLSRMFCDIAPLQEKYAATRKVSVIYVKLDAPANTKAVVESLQNRLVDYKVYSVAEDTSLITFPTLPTLKPSPLY